MELTADVARVDFGGCLLLDDAGRLIEATVRGRLMGPRKSLGNAVVVGDRARAEIEGERTVVFDVEPRRNRFSRRAPGNRPVEQVVAANLDQVVLVASIVEPEFRSGLADRVLAQADHCGIAARIVLTKIELDPRAEADRILAAYARAGLPGHAVSAHTGAGLAELMTECAGRRSLFVGHSGVGKSTLLNALIPGLDLLAGRVNEKTRKGRHTTSAAWLVRPEPGLTLIDTPGVRAFGLWGIDARNLAQGYPELRALLGGCRFADCRHGGEPGCAIRLGLDAGAIARERWDSFLKLRDELEREEAGETERVRATARYRRR